MIENHLDHSQDWKDVLKDNFTLFFQKSKGKLMTLNAKIIELTEEVDSFIEHEKQFTSNKFLRFVSMIKKFDLFDQLLL
jgi:fibrillarin-like rRNA methylase